MAPALYVYGVMRAHECPTDLTAGVQGAEQVRCLEEGDLAALVSEVPESAVPTRRENLLAHPDVLRRALDAGPVLPLRFGVVMPDAETVRQELLGSGRERLSRLLDAIQDRAEMEVKALYREDVLLREVLAENPAIANGQMAVQGKPEEATYFDRIRLGELIAQAVEAKRSVDAAAIVESLQRLAVAVSAGDPLHERMVVNAAFLVDRDVLDEFDAEVDRLGRERADRMTFELIGPLAAHSFAEGEWIEGSAAWA